MSNLIFTDNYKKSIMYVDINNYKLNDVNSVIKYINDCENKYSEDNRYGLNKNDFYDEDGYVDYYFKDLIDKNYQFTEEFFKLYLKTPDFSNLFKGGYHEFMFKKMEETGC